MVDFNHFSANPTKLIQHTNNSSAIANELLECIWPFYGVNPFMHNIEKWPNILLKNFQIMIFKVCLAIFQHKIWKGQVW